MRLRLCNSNATPGSLGAGTVPIDPARHGWQGERSCDYPSLLLPPPREPFSPNQRNLNQCRSISPIRDRPASFERGGGLCSTVPTPRQRNTAPCNWVSPLPRCSSSRAVAEQGDRVKGCAPLPQLAPSQHFTAPSQHRLTAPSQHSRSTVTAMSQHSHSTVTAQSAQASTATPAQTQSCCALTRAVSVARPDRNITPRNIPARTLSKPKSPRPQCLDGS